MNAQPQSIEYRFGPDKLSRYEDSPPPSLLSTPFVSYNRRLFWWGEPIGDVLETTVHPIEGLAGALDIAEADVTLRWRPDRSDAGRMVVAAAEANDEHTLFRRQAKPIFRPDHDSDDLVTLRTPAFEIGPFRFPRSLRPEKVDPPMADALDVSADGSKHVTLSQLAESRLRFDRSMSALTMTDDEARADIASVVGLDSGRWEYRGDGDWMIPGPGIRPWLTEGGHLSMSDGDQLTPDDVLAAARIIRWHQEQGA